MLAKAVLTSRNSWITERPCDRAISTWDLAIKFATAVEPALQPPPNLQQETLALKESSTEDRTPDIKGLLSALHKQTSRYDLGELESPLNLKSSCNWPPCHCIGAMQVEITLVDNG
eukprot:5677410-Karenia_brevis.AAC.1